MDLMTVATNFGVAVMCLVALSLALWRGVVWFGSNIGKPVADRHIRFLDELSTAVASQSQALQNVVVHQNQAIEGIQGVLEKMEEMIEKQDRLVELVMAERREEKS